MRHQSIMVQCAYSQCGVPFRAYHSRLKTGQSRFCSKPCAYAGVRERTAPLPEATCKRCGATYRPFYWQVRQGRAYCSRACNVLARRDQQASEAPCAQCGKLGVSVRHRMSREHFWFCGAACRTAWRDARVDRWSKAKVERFWRYVEKHDDGCWIWSSSRTPAGYGLAWGTTAHRVAWELTHGRQVPEGLVVRHLCGNGHLACVRPDHLDIGTTLENVADSVRMGRHAKKLTASDVLEIRRLVAAGMSRVRAGVHFNIAAATVSRICLRKSWAHVA